MKKKEGSRKEDKKEGKKQSKKRPKENGTTTLDNDPPIIVQGGSVTIESTVFLSVRYDTTKQKYIYENKDLKIAKMKMKGKKGDQNDDSDNGKFEIELSDV